MWLKADQQVRRRAIPSSRHAVATQRVHGNSRRIIQSFTRDHEMNVGFPLVMGGSWIPPTVSGLSLFTRTKMDIGRSDVSFFCFRWNGPQTDGGEFRKMCGRTRRSVYPLRERSKSPSLILPTVFKTVSWDSNGSSGTR